MKAKILNPDNPVFNGIAVEACAARKYSSHTPRPYSQRRNASPGRRFEMTGLHLHTLKWLCSGLKAENHMKNAALPKPPEPRQYTTR